MTLDEDVALKLKEWGERRKISFKETVNEVLRRGLAAQDRAVESTDPYRVRTFDSAFRPGIDPLKLNQLSDELEARSAAERIATRYGR